MSNTIVSYTCMYQYCSYIIGIIYRCILPLHTVQIQYMYPQRYSYPIVTGAKPVLVPKTGLDPVV